MLLLQFITGTIFGSFLFATYSRLSTGRSIWSPARSHCDSCLTTISWFDLAPIFSYLILRGRCRNCNQRIPIAGFLCELFFGGLLLSWQPTPISTGYILAGSLLFFMAVSDSHRFAFPAGYGYGLMFLTVIQATFFKPHQPTLIFVIVLWLGLQFVEPRLTWIGAGDLDVFLCLLLLLGFTPFAWLLLLSSLSALVSSLLFKRRRLPFIPFIAVSYLLVIFFLY